MNQFQNEIVWKRSSAHSDPKRYGANHDTIFFYTAGKQWTWNKMFLPYSDDYIEQNYRYRDADGRRFRVSDMTANNGWRCLVRVDNTGWKEGEALQRQILGLLESKHA